MPPPAPRPHAVLYYSISGHTDQVAHQIAKSLGADLFRIATKRYGRGPLSYMKAGFDSLTGRLPPITPVADLRGYESVSLGAPIWAGRPAMPLRSYLSQHPALPHSVGLFVTSGGPNAPERAYEVAQGLLGRSFAAILHVPNRLDAPSAQDRVASYCDAIRSASGASALG